MSYVGVRGARIRYHETGSPTDPPVLLLHGIGRSLEDWSVQHDRLAGHRVISADLPGFGLSGRTAKSATLVSFAEAMWAVLDELGAGSPVHLIGNSLGGAVAMQMLAADPGRVATLTLANSAGFGREVATALRLMAVPGLGRRLLARIDPPTARKIERSLFVDRALVTDERVAFALEAARRPDFAVTYVQIAKALGGIRGIAPRWRAELLGRIAGHRTPTLIMWGERDLILPATHLAAARAALPHAETHLFAGTGHMPQVERPDEFAELALAHLRKYAIR